MAEPRRAWARFRPQFSSAGEYTRAYRQYVGGRVLGANPYPLGFDEYLTWIQNKLFWTDAEATAAFAGLWRTSGSWQFGPQSLTHTDFEDGQATTVAYYYHCNFGFTVSATGIEFGAGITMDPDVINGVFIGFDGTNFQVKKGTNTDVGIPTAYAAGDTFQISTIKGIAKVYHNGAEVASFTNPTAGPFYAYMKATDPDITISGVAFALVTVRWWMIAGGAAEAPEWALSKVSAVRKESNAATAMWQDGYIDARITFKPTGVTVSNSLLVGFTKQLTLDPSYGQALRFSPGRWEAVEDLGLSSISGTWQEGDVFDIASSGFLVTYRKNDNILGTYAMTSLSEVTKYGFVKPNTSGTGVTDWSNFYYPPPYWFGTPASNFSNLNLSSGVEHIAAGTNDFVVSSVFPKVGGDAATSVDMIFEVTNLTGDAEVGFTQEYPITVAASIPGIRLILCNAGSGLYVKNTIRDTIDQIYNVGDGTPATWATGSRYRVVVYDAPTAPVFQVQEMLGGSGIILDARPVRNISYAEGVGTTDSNLDTSPMTDTATRAMVVMNAAPNSISMESFDSTSSAPSWITWPQMTSNATGATDEINSLNPTTANTLAKSTQVHYNSELQFQITTNPPDNAGFTVLGRDSDIELTLSGSDFMLRDLTLSAASNVPIATYVPDTLYALQIQSDISAYTSNTSRLVFASISEGNYTQLMAVPLTVYDNSAQVRLRGPYQPSIYALSNGVIELINVSFTTISETIPQNRWRVTQDPDSTWFVTDNFVLGRAIVDASDYSDRFETRSLYETAEVNFAAELLGTSNVQGLVLGWAESPPTDVSSFVNLANTQILITQGSPFPSYAVAGMAPPPALIRPSTRISYNLSGGTVSFRVYDAFQDFSGTLTVSGGPLKFVGGVNLGGSTPRIRYFQLSGTEVLPYWVAPEMFQDAWDATPTSVGLNTSVNTPDPIPYIISREPSGGFVFNFTPSTLIDTDADGAEVGLTTLSGDISDGAVVRVHLYRSGDKYFYESSVGADTWTTATEFSIGETFSIEVSGGAASLYQTSYPVPITAASVSADVTSYPSFYAYFAARRAGDLFSPVAWPGGNVPSLPAGWWITTGSGWTQSVSDGYLTISHASNAGIVPTATTANSVSAELVTILAWTLSGFGTIGLASNGTFYDSVDFDGVNLSYRSVVSPYSSTPMSLWAGDGYGILTNNDVMVDQGPIASAPTEYFGRIESLAVQNFTYSGLSLFTLPNVNGTWDLSGDWGATFFTLSRVVADASSTEVVYSSNSYGFGRLTFEPEIPHGSTIATVGLAETLSAFPTELRFNLGTTLVSYVNEVGASVTSPWIFGDRFSVEWSPNLLQLKQNLSVLTTRWREDGSGNSLSGSLFMAVSASSNVTLLGAYKFNGFAPLFNTASGWTEIYDTSPDLRRLERAGVEEYPLSVSSTVYTPHGEIQVMYESGTTVHSRYLLGKSANEYVGLEFNGGGEWLVRAPEYFGETLSDFPIAHNISATEGDVLSLRLRDGLYEVFVGGTATASGHAWFDSNLRYIASVDISTAAFSARGLEFQKIASTAVWRTPNAESFSNNLGMWNHGPTELEYLGRNTEAGGATAADCQINTILTLSEVCFTVSGITVSGTPTRSILFGVQNLSSQTQGSSGVDAAYLMIAPNGLFYNMISGEVPIAGFDTSGASYGVQYNISGPFQMLTLIATPLSGTPYSNTVNLAAAPYNSLDKQDNTWWPFVLAGDPGTIFTNLSITSEPRLTLSTDANGYTPAPVFEPAWVYDASAWTVSGSMETGWEFTRTTNAGGSNIYWNASYSTGEAYMTVSMIAAPSTGTPLIFGVADISVDDASPDFGMDRQTYARLSNSGGPTYEYAFVGSGITEASNAWNSNVFRIWQGLSSNGQIEAGTSGTEIYSSPSEANLTAAMFYAQMSVPTTDTTFFVTISNNAPNFYGSVSGWVGTPLWVAREPTYLRSFTNVTGAALINASSFAYPEIVFSVSAVPTNPSYMEVGFTTSTNWIGVPTSNRWAIRMNRSGGTIQGVVYIDDSAGAQIASGLTTDMSYRINFTDSNTIQFSTDINGTTSNSTAAWTLSSTPMYAYVTGDNHSNSRYLIDSYAAQAVVPEPPYVPPSSNGWGDSTNWTVSGSFTSTQEIIRTTTSEGAYITSLSGSGTQTAFLEVNSSNLSWGANDYWMDFGMTLSRTDLTSAYWIRHRNPNAGTPQAGSPDSGYVDIWTAGALTLSQDVSGATQFQVRRIYMPAADPDPSTTDIRFTINYGGPNSNFTYDVSDTGSNPWYFFVRTGGASNGIAGQVTFM